MARPARRALAIALLIVAAALLLAACGGGGDGGEDLANGLTPAELLDQSSEAAAALDSFHIALEVTGDLEVSAAAGLPSGVGGLLNGPLDISGDGPVQPPDRASIDLRIKVSGLPLQGNLTRVGDDVFIGVLGQDFRVDLAPEQVALLDFGHLYPTLASWTTDPVEAGPEEIDGEPTVKVTGALDPTTALGGLGPLLGAGSVTAAQARRALSEGTVAFWIGTEDLLPRRVHLVLKADGAGIAEGVGAIDIDLTASFSAFDEPVDIQAPSNPQTLDPDQLGSFFGG
jgi:hypothetical protein